MKANELMIGDYVKFLGRVRKIKSIISKDTGIEISFEGENPVVVSLDEIEPIPLTPEILEKNGFKREKDHNSRWYHAQMERMIITLYRSDTFYSIMINTDCYLPVLNNIQLHSVHELQHALRLCQIDKTIEL